MNPLEEQTILVTGATDGLGRALATALAGRGATVLPHGRDEERLEELAAELGAPRTYRADFASLEDVSAMAGRIRDSEQRLDALVNNAGIGTTLPGDGERVESADGYELRLQVNYLAHYLLTRELLPLLRDSAPARIVNVSSAGQAPIDFDDPMLEEDYDGTRAYCQSKLAQVMLTLDLAEELEGAGVTVNCLHPATYMPTKMVHAAGVDAASTMEEGTATTLRLVAEPELDDVTGRYFNGQREADAHEQAYDGDARRRLRDLSERLVEEAVAGARRR
jgi:NAD(P)-dependent dehydrogenase (short-subunit alcohol dehydrogenase family)